MSRAASSTPASRSAPPHRAPRTRFRARHQVTDRITRSVRRSIAPHRVGGRPPSPERIVGLFMPLSFARAPLSIGRRLRTGLKAAHLQRRARLRPNARIRQPVQLSAWTFVLGVIGEQEPRPKSGPFAHLGRIMFLGAGLGKKGLSRACAPGEACGQQTGREAGVQLAHGEHVAL